MTTNPSGPDRALPVAADALGTLLELSLSGAIFFRPVLAPANPAEIIDLAYVHLNPAAQRLLGLPACPPESFLTLYPAARSNGVFAFYAATFRSGEAGHFEGRDGRDRLAARRCGPLLVVSLADPERSAVENARRASRARQQEEELAQLFMEAPAPIVILAGPALVFQLVNPAYQHIFPGRALVGKPLLEALPELAETPIPALLRRVYETGEPYVAQEMPLMMARNEGAALEEIYWTFSYQARRDERGAIDGLRVFAHEVTAPVRARQQALALAAELTAANRELTRVNADLDAFTYTASHDLRTPIANIEGLLRILVEQLPAVVRHDANVQPLLHHMQGAVERFQRTLTQLTDVIREQAAQAQAAELVELAVLVEGVRLDLAPQLASAQAQLLVDVASCATLSFAPRNLRSIVYNLVSNAVKYRDPTRLPVVQVRCRPGAGATVLEVADNGLGLDKGQQARLFGLFERPHNHVAGSGVGLYTVRKIVENAGGTIAVQSRPGVGSTFTVTLPDPAAGVAFPVPAR